MSTYRRITRHPRTGFYEKATWHDDYFAPHVYGVEFDDGKVYPVDMVEEKQIYDFWRDDVLTAFHKLLEVDATALLLPEVKESLELDFLNLIQKAYLARWKKDPETGGGATVKSRVVK